jgi:hypothetical protein
LFIAGKWPLAEMRPGVGFSPAMPQKCAGMRMEPPPSLPIPPAEQNEAMAAASPPLDPPGVRSRFHGLLVRPVMKLSVSKVDRNSGVLVFPRNSAGGAQAGDGGGVLGGFVSQAEAAAAQRGQAGDVEAVLDGHRNAVQQSQRLAVHDGVFRAPGGRAGPVLEHQDESVDAGILGGDLCQVGLDQFHGRNGAVAHHSGHEAQRTLYGHESIV